MSQNNRPNPFFPEEPFDRDDLFVEVPSEPRALDYDRIPSGYTPMGEIHLRGRAFTNVRKGRISWTMLISSWIIFGVPAIFLMALAIATFSFPSFLLLCFSALVLVILWKGTVNKLFSKRRR